MTLPVEHLTWQKGGQDEADLRNHLVRALIRSGVCVTLQDASLDYIFIANPSSGASNHGAPAAGRRLTLRTRGMQTLPLLDDQVPEGSLSDHCAVACEAQLHR